MKGEDTTEPLLTDGEKHAALQRMLGSRYTNNGKLYLPTTLIYNSVDTDEGITALALNIFRWLGIKPRKLSVYYSDKVTLEQMYIVSEVAIALPKTYSEHPYMAGAAVVMGVLKYSLGRGDKNHVDVGFLEFASIHTGLGLWVLNALPPKTGFGTRMYHLTDGGWYRIEGLKLHAFSAYQYAEHIAQYAHSNRLLAEEYLPSVSKHVRHLLPEHTTKHTSRELVDPQKVYAHEKSVRTMWARITLTSSIIAVITLTAAYIYAKREPEITNEQLQEEYSLLVLKKSYESCEKQANEKRNQYNPNDIFLNRHVDATESRCESLRNQYNHAIDQYNQLYKK